MNVKAGLFRVALGISLAVIGCTAFSADKTATTLDAKSLVVKGSAPYIATIRRALSDDKSKRIVDGEEAKAGSRPWQVALVATAFSDNLRGQFCGGTLVAPSWVVTAAHCVDSGLQPYQVAVVPGILSLTDAAARRVAVKRIVVHPKWNSKSNDSDIALLELASSAQPTASVRAIPFSSTSADPAAGTVLTVSGWGATKEGGAGSVVLLTADIPSVTRDACKASYSGLTANMICAGREQGGRDSCQGDSGGPAVTNASSSPVLVGVVSWGYGCARPKNYGVYTHVGRFGDWIRQTAALQP